MLLRTATDVMKAAVLALATWLAMAGGASAQGAFYAGKTLTIVVSTGPAPRPLPDSWAGPRAPTSTPSPSPSASRTWASAP